MKSPAEGKTILKSQLLLLGTDRIIREIKGGYVGLPTPPLELKNVKFSPIHKRKKIAIVLFSPCLEHSACTDFTCDERLSYLDIYSISISNCLITFNASVNFLIYAFNSSKFRQLVVMKYRKAYVCIKSSKWIIQEKIAMLCTTWCTNSTSSSKRNNSVENQVDIVVKFHTNQEHNNGTRTIQL